MKRYENRMTENQYRTLRRLILLWFNVVVRRKYSIFLNLLLAASLVSNAVFIYVYKTGSHISIIEKPIDFSSALDMKNYDSVSNGSKHTLQKRFGNIYKKFMEDKEKPDAYYYLGDKKTVDADWSKYCKIQLRKIIFIKARIRDIENLLEKSYPDRVDEIQKIIEQNRDEEVLSDMSNYYARFLSTEDYQYIIRNAD